MLHLAWLDFLPLLPFPTLLCPWKSLSLIRNVSSALSLPTVSLPTSSLSASPAQKSASVQECHFCMPSLGSHPPRTSGLRGGLVSPHRSPAQLLIPSPSSPSLKLLLRVMPCSCIDLYPSSCCSSTDSGTTHFIQGLRYLVHRHPLPFPLKSCHHPGRF